MKPLRKPGPRPFRFNGPDVAADIRMKYGYEGALLDLYAKAGGRDVHKWHHYIPLYDRYFAPFRGKPVRFLEIGSWRGGSLAMWREYFGPEAVIFGIDIDPACAAFNGEAGQVRIGSQDDPEFLAQVVAEMGGIDIVLDDGSHRMNHVRESLRQLFPLLANDGIYMIEDLHCAYWQGFGGGLDAPGNFYTNFLPRLFDDMHRWYHDGKLNAPRFSRMVSGVHVHDSLVVLEKGPVHAPVNSICGASRGAAPAGEAPTAKAGSTKFQRAGSRAQAK